MAAAATIAIAAGTATDTVIKSTSGTLYKVLVTSTAGAAVTSIFDNASSSSGTVIGALPSAVSQGTVATFEMPAAHGITVQGASTNPAMTISYS